jgi:4-hydroxy-2-oxoheptanedioate aldolase
MEHRPFGYDVIGPISLACRANGIDLMVRVLKTGYSSPMRVLEFGANGIMVPHCRDEAEARQWVEWTRFPPLGRRGFDGSGADADFMLANPCDHLRHANEETFLVLQVEDQEAVECVDRIAAVPGVDLLFVGLADLTISYGLPFQFQHPRIREAIDRVAAAARQAGIWWGMPTGNAEAAQAALDSGARLVTCSNDHVALVRTLQQAASDFAGLRVRR